MAFVYILSNERKNVLYVGSTDNLIVRLSQHKAKVLRGFTSKYNVDRLVYYEVLDSIQAAQERESKIKKKKRSGKDALIAATNPTWASLNVE